MGCDIHLYLEHKENDKWWGTPRMPIGRYYGLFAVIAGVRDYNTEVEMFEPRGVPKDISWNTLDDYTLYIVDHETNEMGCCSREQAESYAKYSPYWDIKKTRIEHPDWHSASWLTLAEYKIAYQRYLDYFKQPCFPDLAKYRESKDHEGFIKELEILKDKTEPISPIPEVEASIAYLEALSKYTLFTRVVFWFDN